MRKYVYGRTCALRSVGDVSGLRGDPEAVDRFTAEHPGVDVYIYWHAITYFLTGDPESRDEPLCYLIHGGETIGQTEAGPVRYLEPERVRSFHAAIAGISPDDFGEELYDLGALDAKGIYPERWQLDGEESDLLSAVRELFSYLQGYVASAAASGKGIVVFYGNSELYFDDEDDE